MNLKASIIFKNKTDDAIVGIEKNLAIAVEKSLYTLERAIKIETPVKHGNLKRSITKRMTGKFEGDVFTSPLEDGKELNYAIYVEYGTRYMAPRAMFRKGVANSEAEVDQIFNTELNKKVV